MTSPRAAGEYAGSMVDPLRLASALRRGPAMQMGDVVDIRTKAKTSSDDDSYAAPTADQLRAQREIEGVNDLLRYPDQKAIDDYINMEGIVAGMPLNHPARPELESLRDQMQERLTKLSEPAAHTLFDKGPSYKTSAEFRKFLGMKPEERVLSKAARRE
jgi:hypothetical protein